MPTDSMIPVGFFALAGLVRGLRDATKIASLPLCSALSHPGAGALRRPEPLATGIAATGRTAAGRVSAILSAHADAQIAVAVHAQLHIRKLARTRRVLYAHALAVLAGGCGPPAVAIASLAVKERHVQAALPAEGLREQGHLATRHTSSSSRPIRSANAYYEIRRICVRNLMKRKKCGRLMIEWAAGPTAAQKTHAGGKL